MIPENPSLDDSWSEFERYSTNDCIRQLLEVQANSEADRTATNDGCVFEFSFEFIRFFVPQTQFDHDGIEITSKE